MIRPLAGFGAASLVALGIALGGAPATAESVMQKCGSEWQAAKAAGTTNGLTWPQFLSKCRVGQTAGMGGGEAPSGVPTPAPAPSMHSIPALPPTQTTGAPPAPAAVPTPLARGEFAFEQQARARCPSDTIVWVNNFSHIYHYNVVSSHGRHFYGNTENGGYMCERDAMAAGDRAAKDEKHP